MIKKYFLECIICKMVNQGVLKLIIKHQDLRMQPQFSNLELTTLLLNGNWIYIMIREIKRLLSELRVEKIVCLLINRVN